MTTFGRRGDWIQTASLRQFFPLDPRPEDVCLEDIARALSQQCRFSGHTSSFYSVAQHSVLVSLRVEELSGLAQIRLHLARWGLLHDAAEAYLVDLPRPLKKLPEFEPYRLAEAAVTRAIAEKFDLGGEEPAEVKAVDQRLCYTEARDLFPGVHPAWEWLAEPFPFRIVPMTSTEARVAFLARFRELWPAWRAA